MQHKIKKKKTNQNNKNTKQTPLLSCLIAELRGLILLEIGMLEMWTERLSLT